MKSQTYEKYPKKIVLFINLVFLSLYAIGIYFTYLISKWFGLIFLIYILFIEIKIYREGCVHCYYYGKLCAFGKGKIASLFFKKGDPKKFCEKIFTWKTFIPHMVVGWVPVIAGIYLLIKDFNFTLLILLIWILIINLIGNQIIYGKVACPNCKQGQKCCPAVEYFGKKR